MSDFNDSDEEQVSRQEAAERLIDVAYALTAGGPLELSVSGRRIKVPMGSTLQLARELSSAGDRVQLRVQLTWPAPAAGLP